MASGSSTSQDAGRFLAGVLTRDIRTYARGNAQYTTWCDDRGFVIEDGVILRPGKDEFLLTAVATIPFFGLAQGEIAGAPVTVSRTGYSGDLGYEVWVGAADALKVWDAMWESFEGHGVPPFGLAALYMLRIEAGLLLLDVDFSSSRFGWTDEDCSTPIELGWSWMLRDLASDDRAFIGRRAIEREIAERTSRWRLTGLIVDGADYDRIYDRAGLIPPKDHTPIHDEYFVYDDDGNQVGYATSSMYSPILQRHMALTRVRSDLAAPGTPVRLEIDVNHRYEYVTARTARLPLYNPARKMA